MPATTPQAAPQGAAHAASTADAEAVRDPFGALIVAKGLAPSLYVLDINGAITVPDDFPLPPPWNLPSRLFRSPIEVHRPEHDYPRAIGLRHPLLADHPFVQHVEAALGIAIARDGARNHAGYSSSEVAQWWHAVDLVTAGLWQELLATSDFTNPDAMFRAVSIGLRYARDDAPAHHRFATREARRIMAALGATEPADRAAPIHSLSEPAACRSEGKAEQWPINTGFAAEQAEAWAFIFGLEDGWFERDGAGFLQWSPSGRARYAAGDGCTFTDAGGQMAFGF